MNSIQKKGIILAGGSGSRLAPLTDVVSKQLLPLYNKPMIYYPLTTLMRSGINNFLIITAPEHLRNFKLLLGDGKQWGIDIEYKIQERPEGIAQALLISEEFIKDTQITLILGDNLFFGNDLINKLKKAFKKQIGATVFAYPVVDPNRYGVVSFNKENKVISIEEKPSSPKSRYAITGIYVYDSKVIKWCKKLKPSQRGELEISDLNSLYLKDNSLNVELLGSGTTWLDTGTFESLYEANSLIKTLDNRQGQKIGYPEEEAWRNGWINKKQLITLAKKYYKNEYGKYLLELASNYI